MAREYDASRRQEAARRTREAILAAAFRLHGQGIFDLESLAREADVSVATVRKHFPNRELLFEGCTAYGFHQVSTPDPVALAAVTDPAIRLTEAVRQAYALHEGLFGQVWGAYKLADESAVLSATLRDVEGLMGALTEIVMAAWPDFGDTAGELRGLISGLLSPLAYRALRAHGHLSPEQATRSTTGLLLQALEAGGLPSQGEADDR
jgi:AcrR family transcriptional regulator